MHIIFAQNMPADDASSHIVNGVEDASKRLKIIISSPSGGGKSTICKMLLSREDSPLFNVARFSISHTTRAPRDGEINGRDYYFVSQERFSAMIDQGEFLEYANVFGNFYGSAASALSPNGHTIFDIDYQGHRQIKSKISCLGIFLMPPSLIELRERVVSRGDLTEAQMSRRLASAPEEIIASAEYDHVVENRSLEKCFAEVCAKIRIAAAK